MSKAIKILIVGNGFGGTYSLKHLQKLLRGNKNVELSLVGEKNYFIFTPLLHEIATGGINPENIIEPIRKVLGHCLKDFYLGKVESVDLTNRTVKVGDLCSIPYDYLILAPGSETNFYGMSEVKKHAFTLKSIDDAVRLKNHILMQMERATHTNDEKKRQQMLRFVVVGGGPTGVELVAELHEFIKGTFSYYYPEQLIKDTSVVLVESGAELMSAFGEKMRKKSLELLKKRDINIMLSTRVKEVSEHQVMLGDGTSLDTETVIWVAGIKPVDIEFIGDAEKTKEGRIVVNEYLQIPNHKEVFAIGDFASFIQNNSPLPALAQVAEKQAKGAALNIKRMIEGKSPESFYYKHSGYLLSLGRFMAIGEIAHVTFWGRMAWLFWRTVYLSKLISTRKKLEVALDWTINLFSPRDISQI